MSTPLLKWAGGKTKLLPELLARMPETYGRYYEPFCGGAALFFALQPECAVLNDVNADLIEMYRTVATDADAVIDKLMHHKTRHGSRYYSSTRDWWNSVELTSAAHAAALIYLNRTCYNGLWRVNRAGKFNVPIGRYKDPLAGISDRVRDVAPVLARAVLCSGDYRAAISDAQPGDFVYFDPPYDGTFTGYTGAGFDDAAQAELAFEVRKLAERGVQVMISNADTPRIRALYAGLRIDTVRCPRAINSNASKRGEVNEVIITAGYDPAAERAA